MNFIEFNKEIRELEKGCWRKTAFEDLQVQYCEEGLYALRCKRGTPNEHICLIRGRNADAAISRAVFDLHKRGEIDAEKAKLRHRLKVAETALMKVIKNNRIYCCVGVPNCKVCAFKKTCDYAIAKAALAAIREKGEGNTKRKATQVICNKHKEGTVK